MGEHVGTCPVCHGAVGKYDNGMLMEHNRYADGAGPGPDQPHGMVHCEGSFTRDAETTP